MTVFLLTGPPLAFLLMLLLSREGSVGKSVQPLLNGVLVWAIGYLVQLLFAPLGELVYTPGRIYLFYLFHDHVFWMVCAIGGYLVVSLLRRKSRSVAPQGAFGTYGAFILGVFLLQPMVDLIQYHKILNVYYLFLLPALRIVLIVAFSSVFSLTWTRSLLLRTTGSLVLVSVAFLVALVPFFYTTSHAGISYLLTFLFFSGAGSLGVVALRAEQ